MFNIGKELRERGPSGVFDLAREAAKQHVYDLRSRGEISFSDPKEGNIPSIHIVRRTVPEAWETATMALMGVGQSVHTGYDPRDHDGEYTSFPSLEGTVTMYISDPDGEPRFHKHFLGGWMGFGAYQAEIEGCNDDLMIYPAFVVKMIKDGRFNEIREDTKWKYTYSQRIRNFPFIDIEGQPQTINQLNSVIAKLTREPLSKSGQVSTWDPRWDHHDDLMGVSWKEYDSPCLQRLWFRLVPLKDGYALNVNWDFRSRDHLKAVPQNIYGLFEGMYEHVRQELAAALNVPIYKARVVDKSDSLHLYGHYFDVRSQGKDAEAYLLDIGRVASGEALEDRLVLPGTPMYDIMMEDLDKEYKDAWNTSNIRRAQAGS